MAQITLDLGGGGPALQTEDEEDKEKTRKRRPVNKKTTRGEGSAERVRGGGGSGVTACVWVHPYGGATRRAGRCAYMVKPPLFFFSPCWLMSLWLTRYKDYVPLENVGI